MFAFSLNFTAFFKDIMPDLVREVAILGFWVVIFKYKFGSTLSWTTNWFYAEPWIDFSYKPFMGGRKVHFSLHDSPFLPVCGFFFLQIVSTTW